MIDSISDKLYLAELEAVEVVVIAESNEQKIKNLNKIIEDTLTEKSKGNLTMEGKFVITYSTEEVKEFYKEISEGEFIIKVSIAKHKVVMKRIGALIDKLEEIVHWSLLLFILGFCLSYLGFQFWYLRVQKPIDKQAKESLIET